MRAPDKKRARRYIRKYQHYEKCQRCGHTFAPRKGTKVCPNPHCHSTLWNVKIRPKRMARKEGWEPIEKQHERPKKLWAEIMAMPYEKEE